jgi:hypothetical protein
VIEEPETSERFAGNQLLVGLRAGVDLRRIFDILDFEGASLIGFDPVFEIFQIGIDGDATAEVVRRAQADFARYAEVEFAEPNHQVELAAPFPNDQDFPAQGSLGLVRAVEAWLGAGDLARPGDARDLAVFDSGVNHTDLNVRAGTGKNCVNPGAPLTDTGGHGTKVAGVAAAKFNNVTAVAGAARDARLVPIVIKGNGDRSYVDAVLCALRYIRQHPEQARVVNLSVGFEENLFLPGEKGALKRGIEQTLGGGTVIVAAAGNGEGPTGSYEDKFYPAGFNDVLGAANGDPDNGLIAVANTDAAGRPFEGNARRPAAEYATRRGPWVDVAAPGVEVHTLTSGGGTGPDTGTSLSAPLIAGAAALLWSRNPTATIGQVERQLKDAARAAPGAAGIIGRGSLDFGETVFNGSMELSIPENGSPASWTSVRGACDYVRVPASAVGFFRPRDGRQFLLCNGNGVAATRKFMKVPPNTSRLVLGVRIAVIALAPTAEVALDVRFRPFDQEAFSIKPVLGQHPVQRCNGRIDLPGAPDDLRCSGWQNWQTMVVPQPAAGRAIITFRVQHVDGAGPIYLLLDQLEIAEIN